MEISKLYTTPNDVGGKGIPGESVLLSEIGG